LIDGVSSDAGYGISACSDGVYVTGYATGPNVQYDINDTNKNFDVVSEGAFVIKYDLDGKYIWHQLIDGGSSDEGYGISACSDGVYVTGIATGPNVQYDINDTNKNFDVNGTGMFVIKYDLEGNYIWHQLINLTTSDIGYGISASTDGVYVTGSLANSLLAFVIKYDLAGNLEWFQFINGVSNDAGYGISACSDGVYVTGVAMGPNVQYDINDANKKFDVVSGGAFVIKYDIDGNYIWHQLIDGVSSDVGRGISACSDGVYVSGYAYGPNVQYDINDTNKKFDVNFLGAFVIKYDLDGNYIWHQLIDGIIFDFGFGISAGSDGVYVTGFLFVGIDVRYDINDTNKIFNISGASAFVIKYDLDGNSEWYQLIEGPNAEGGTGISAYSDGVYVTGLATETNVQYDINDTNKFFDVNSTGAFVIKYCY
jgi:predicted RNA-binding protein with TRAM domain